MTGQKLIASMATSTRFVRIPKGAELFICYKFLSHFWEMFSFPGGMQSKRAVAVRSIDYPTHDYNHHIERRRSLTTSCTKFDVSTTMAQDITPIGCEGIYSCKMRKQLVLSTTTCSTKRGSSSFNTNSSPLNERIRVGSVYTHSSVNTTSSVV
jgi:hypothetical protein